MYDLKFIAKKINATIYQGDPSFSVSQVGDLSKVNSRSIVFINSKKFTENINFSTFGACLSSEDCLPNIKNCKNILLSKNPYHSFALLTNLFDNETSKEVDSMYRKVGHYYVGSGSVVSDLSKISKNVVIGCNCVIEDGVVIRENSTIDHNVTIYKNTAIGSNCKISSGTVIGSQGFGFSIDKDKNWHHISHLGSVVIGDSVNIGSNCSIDRGTLVTTTISNGVIIDNNVHIAHNVCIGEKTAIAGKAAIAGSTIIGKRCQIGGMSGIFGHLKITDDVIITPKSNIYRNINKPGTYSSLFPQLESSKWKKINILVSKIDKILSLKK